MLAIRVCVCRVQMSHHGGNEVLEIFNQGMPIPVYNRPSLINVSHSIPFFQVWQSYFSLKLVAYS